MCRKILASALILCASLFIMSCKKNDKKDMCHSCTIAKRNIKVETCGNQEFWTGDLLLKKRVECELEYGVFK